MIGLPIMISKILYVSFFNYRFSLVQWFTTNRVYLYIRCVLKTWWTGG